MNKNSFFLKIVRIILITLGVHSLFFQFFKFIFGTHRGLNGNSNIFESDIIPHGFTIIICVWFIIYQIQQIRKK